MLDSVIKGDTVREVLNYVQFSSDSLVAMLRRDVETALRESRLTYEESGALLKFYEEGLHGYTYLEDRPRAVGLFPLRGMQQRSWGGPVFVGPPHLVFQHPPHQLRH